MGAEGRWDGDLDGLSEGALEALVADLTDLRPVPVQRGRVGGRKNKKAAYRRSLDIWEAGMSLRGEYDLVVRLPGYLIAALEETGDPSGAVREMAQHSYGKWALHRWAIVQEGRYRETLSRRSTRWLGKD